MITHKICEPKQCFQNKDLNPKQKNLLFDLMEKYGATRAFAYDRFFKEGFLEWELVGIAQIKAGFLKEHERELWLEKDEEGEIGYAGVLSLDAENNFYDILGRVRGLRVAFIRRMGELGMSENTVIKRFLHSREEDFKEYQIMGIRAIMDEFEEVLENDSD